MVFLSRNLVRIRMSYKCCRNCSLLLHAVILVIEKLFYMNNGVGLRLLQHLRHRHHVATQFVPVLTHYRDQDFPVRAKAICI
jgi:hypothetical protein